MRCRWISLPFAALVAMPAPAQALRVPLTGSVVDDHGAPVADAVVEVFRGEFAVQASVTVAGVVADPQGIPRADVYVAVIGYEIARTPPFGTEAMWLPARTDAQGRFAIAGVHRHLDATLMLRCDGFASVVYALPRVKAGERFDAGTLRLQPAEVVRGTARDPDGRPLPDVEMQLRGCNADRSRLAPAAGGPSIVDNYVATRSARTDAQGRFAFGDVPAGHYAAGFAVTPQQQHPVAVDVDVDAGKPTTVVALVR